MADKAPATPKLYKILKPITYRGEINEGNIDALIAGARLDAAQIAAAAKLSNKTELIAWYKSHANGVTHPNLPPILLPFDHLAESALALLIKRGIVAAA